jgi:hypothetical protein
LCAREQVHQRRVAFGPHLHRAPGEVVEGLVFTSIRRLEGQTPALGPLAAWRRRGLLSGYLGREADDQQGWKEGPHAHEQVEVQADRTLSVHFEVLRGGPECANIARTGPSGSTVPFA